MKGAHNGSVHTFALSLVGGMASAGAVAVGVSRPWVEATATVPGLPPLAVTVTGGDIAPLAGALGLVLLASFGAVLATRGRARKVVGLLIVACAVTVLVVTLHPGATEGVVQERLAGKGWVAAGNYVASTQLWRWVTLIGGAGCLAAGVLVVRAGAAWPTMGKRYDAPAPAGTGVTVAAEPFGDESDNEEALWRALDEGRDPTRDS